MLGWQFGVPVLVLDFAKGFLPVFLAAVLVRTLSSNPYELLVTRNLFGSRFEALQVICALGAILGHVFTPVLRFRGGKGVATTAGVIAALSPKTFLLCLALFLIILLLTRYLSLASIAAAIALPIATALFVPGRWTIFAFTLLVAVILLVRHISNVRRLLAGTENRFVWRSHQDLK